MTAHDRVNGISAQPQSDEEAQTLPVLLPRSTLIQGPLIRRGRGLEIALAVQESEQVSQRPIEISEGPKAVSRPNPSRQR